MSTRVRLGGGPSRVPRVATTASTGSRSGRSGGSSRDRLRSVGQPRTSRQPLGASPIANQQRTRTTRTVPSAMRRSSSSASGTMGRSGRARTAEISDEYAAEYAAFNNFYAVKLPNQKLRLTQMDMGRSYYRQVQRIRMRRSIGLLSIGSATRGIAPAALAAMRGALLGNNERAERGAAASTMALINAFAGKPLIANWKMECFANAKRLGKGKFGTVYLSKERRTGIILALKRLTKAQLVKYKVEKQLRREVEIHARMSHPNVLRMFDHFFDADYIYIMLEFAPGGEMYDKLEHAKNQRFSEAKAACYTRDVAAGLDYIHSLDVIHRDLKPENLLLTRDDTVQIADFGWSVHTPSGRSKTLCGTLDYLAPEMALKQPHDKNLDTWTLGILCYEFIHGQPPFEEETQKETMKRIKNVDLKFPKYLPRHTSVEVKLTDGARELINLFLKRDPADRLPLSEVPRNPWIHEHCSLGYE